MVPNSFKDLMSEIDDDHSALSKSEFPRARVYYDIYINERKSSVVTRKLKDRYNNKISFLICVDHDTNDEHKSMLYISDLEIVETLLDLDERTYSQIAELLINCSLSTADTDNMIVMKRKEIHNGLPGIELDASSDVICWSVDNPTQSVKTPHGISISIASLCDLICLVLSSENSSKRKIIATKYYVYRAILTDTGNNLPANTNLAGLKSMQDIKKVYQKKRTVEEENEFDKMAFGNGLYDEYFKSLA